MREYKLLIKGKWEESKSSKEIKSPYDGQLVGRTYRCGAEEIELAMTAATEAFSYTKDMPIYEKAEKLSLIIEGLKSGGGAERVVASLTKNISTQFNVHILTIKDFKNKYPYGGKYYS